PQAKSGCELTSKGAAAVTAVKGGTSGNDTTDCPTDTPGYVSETNTPSTPVASTAPALVMVTSTSLHSFGSIFPLPLPPVTLFEYGSRIGVIGFGANWSMSKAVGDPQ